MVCSSGVALSDKIAFLQELTETPNKPETNPTPGVFLASSDTEQRVLKFDDEVSIAQAFAVYLALPDDKNKVAAVCVEEAPSGDALTVHFAMNTGCTQVLQDALTKVAAHLMKIARTGNPHSYAQLLVDVVESSLKRILRCLGSRHATGALEGKTVIRRLHDAFPLIVSVGSVTKQLSGCVVRLKDAFKKLEATEVTNVSTSGVKHIVAVLEESAELVEVHKLGLRIDDIPAEVFRRYSDDLTNLTLGVERLAQYVLASQHLCAMANRYRPLFTKIVVRCENLEALRTEGADSLEPSESTRGVLHQHSEEEEEATALAISLKRLTSKTPDELFRVVRNFRGQNKRVHAEIQLLLHYELRTHEHLRPRVICSHKKACYLCDSFVKAHGKFYCPETHGRLYKLWRIPNVLHLLPDDQAKSSLRSSVHGLNAALAKKIESCLHRPPEKSGSPCEDAVFRSRIMAPALGSYAATPPVTPGLVAGEELTPNRPLSLRDRRDSGIADVESTKPPENGTASTKNPVQSDPRETHSIYLPAPLPFSVDTITLEQEVPVPYRLRPGAVVKIQSPKIHLEFSYDDLYVAASSSALNLPAALPPSGEPVWSLLAQWRSRENVTPALRSGSTVDLSAPWTLCTLTPGILFSDVGVAFYKKSEVIVVKAQIANPAASLIL